MLKRRESFRSPYGVLKVAVLDRTHGHFSNRHEVLFFENEKMDGAEHLILYMGNRKS